MSRNGEPRSMTPTQSCTSMARAKSARDARWATSPGSLRFGARCDEVTAAPFGERAHEPQKADQDPEHLDHDRREIPLEPQRYQDQQRSRGIRRRKPPVQRIEPA